MERSWKGVPTNVIFIYSIGQGKSSAVLCGPPISLEMETNYPCLHGLLQKYRSAGMWADRILGSRTLFFSIIQIISYYYTYTLEKGVLCNELSVS